MIKANNEIVSMTLHPSDFAQLQNLGKAHGLKIIHSMPTYSDLFIFVTFEKEGKK